jgi:hypothetical protein
MYISIKSYFQSVYPELVEGRKPVKICGQAAVHKIPVLRSLACPERSRGREAGSQILTFPHIFCILSSTKYGIIFNRLTEWLLLHLTKWLGSPSRHGGPPQTDLATRHFPTHFIFFTEPTTANTGFFQKGGICSKI